MPVAVLIQVLERVGRALRLKYNSWMSFIQAPSKEMSQLDSIFSDVSAFSHMPVKFVI